MIFNIKLKDTNIYNKHKHEKDKLYGDFMRRKTLKSGAFYGALTKLYIEQIKEVTNLYYDAIIEAIDKNELADENLKNKIIGYIRPFIGNHYHNKNVELKGLFIHDNVLNSIIVEGFFGQLEAGKNELIRYFISLLSG